MKSRWLVMFGMTNPALAFAAIERAIGFAKKGIFEFSIRSKISFIRSGGMAEPSA